MTVIHNIANNSILLSWSAPFSLNISESDTDILYYYIVIDSISTTTISTTDTHYLLQSDTCLFLEYHVEIAAVNAVGVGEKYISPPLTLEGMYTQNSNYALNCSSCYAFRTELSLLSPSITLEKDSLVIEIQV